MTKVLTAEDCRFLRALVRKHAAIVLDDDKDYLVESRLAPVARREGLASVTDLIHRLRTGDPTALRGQVIEAMATKETSFFRDWHPFEALRDLVFPELIQRRAAARRLRIWCAACATGQEPYSVAMLVHAHFPALASWDVRILASDLSAGILERARLGRFSRLEVNRGLPAPFLVRYFEERGSDWQIKEPVRSLVEFFPLNLIDVWPALPLPDVILLRNVLIYFDAPTKKQILGKVCRLLRPDGYLFLGGAETTLNLDDNFERVQLGRAGGHRLRGPS